jgi:putative ABC transport system substrate-binding protein
VGASTLGVSSAGLGLLAGCGRLPWQEPPRSYRVGILFDGGAERPSSHPGLAVIVRRLNELGYIEGQNLVIEYRPALWDRSRLPDLAAELVHLPVDVILAAGTPASFAAAQATSSIPIVTPVGDPVRAGLADSYARPGRNVTGITVLNALLSTKRLELLKQTVQSAARIAVLWTVSNISSVFEYREIETVAPLLGVELVSLAVNGTEEFEAAFEAARREGADALVVIEDSLTLRNVSQVATLAAKSNLPGMYGSKESALAGGLMSYGPLMTDNYARAADYMDRILKGAKPADLPVEQPMLFEFVVNLKTARELGITFPDEIMLQVTEVIQ